MTVAYRINANGDHLGDDEETASLIKFAGWAKPAGLIATTEPKFPAQILFEANLDTLKIIDYPITDSGWPVMSKRMLETLLSVGTFAHRKIPLVMLDDTIRQKLDADGKPLPNVLANHDFSAVQITEYTDAFDRERSTFVASEFIKDRVSSATKLVLKDVPLPPLFRILAFPGPLMVSAAAKTALEREGIRGIRYLPTDQ